MPNWTPDNSKSRAIPLDQMADLLSNVEFDHQDLPMVDLDEPVSAAINMFCTAAPLDLPDSAVAFGGFAVGLFFARQRPADTDDFIEVTEAWAAKQGRPSFIEAMTKTVARIADHIAED